MKAIQIFKYNKQDISATLVEIAKPEIQADEVLVRIKAAGVNPLDNKITRGGVKMLVPHEFPLIIGHEFAGVVEEIGSQVQGLSVGDKVYGLMPTIKAGAFAEWAAVPASMLAPMPAGMSYTEATSIPLTALTAMQAFELMNVKAGESIFISGGTGSLGAMAIPLAKSLGLSVYTKGSADGESVTKVREAIEILKERNVDFEFDGEFQLDAAIVPEVAKSKAPGSKVAGYANVLIFPDLNSGNIGYKLTQRLAGAKALGPLIQGLASPVHDLSRGCSVEDIVEVVAITAVESEQK